MTKAITCVIVTIFLIGAVTMSAAAFNPSSQGAMPNHFARILKLTDDQQQKLLVIHQDFQKDTLPARQKLELTRFELKKLWKAQTLDSSKINAQVKIMTDLRIQLVQKRRAMFEQVKAVLTPEQIKTIENYRSRKGQFGMNRSKHHFASCNRMQQTDNGSLPTQ